MNNSNQTQKLGTCPDCLNLISHQAFSCPRCGCPLKQNNIVSRRGWSWTVAWGVILGYFGILIISTILFFTVGALIAGMITSIGKSETNSSNYR